MEKNQIFLLFFFSVIVRLQLHQIEILFASNWMFSARSVHVGTRAHIFRCFFSLTLLTYTRWIPIAKNRERKQMWEEWERTSNMNFIHSLWALRGSDYLLTCTETEKKSTNSTSLPASVTNWALLTFHKTNLHSCQFLLKKTERNTISPEFVPISFPHFPCMLNCSLLIVLPFFAIYARRTAQTAPICVNGKASVHKQHARRTLQWARENQANYEIKKIK